MLSVLVKTMEQLAVSSLMQCLSLFSRQFTGCTLGNLLALMAIVMGRRLRLIGFVATGLVCLLPVTYSLSVVLASLCSRRASLIYRGQVSWMAKHYQSLLQGHLWLLSIHYCIVPTHSKPMNKNSTDLLSMTSIASSLFLVWIKFN